MLEDPFPSSETAGQSNHEGYLGYLECNR